MTLFIGDCRASMREMIAQGVKVQMCVTSPPYFGLRDYGTATWEGGDQECGHKAPSRFDYPLNASLGPTGAQDQASNAGSGSVQQFKGTCGKCGATRIDSQLGLEATPAEYVAAMVEVFGLVRDLLADDGTLWLNLGDSYNGYMANQRGTGLETGRQQARKYIDPGAGLRTDIVKNKDLIGIPWRVAFALQEAGWYLRQDIIWHKPNPMPESVTDRCTKSHEYLFLLSKRERYYYDADAIAEPAIHAGAVVTNDAGKNSEMGKHGQTRGGFLKEGGVTVGETRNKRSVWTVATQPYAEAHFATFPPALIEPCILAGSRPGDTVLDPFFGSGTTGQVAEALGRRWIGCELNPQYEALIRQRTAQQGLALQAMA